MKHFFSFLRWLIQDLWDFSLVTCLISHSGSITPVFSFVTHLLSSSWLINLLVCHLRSRSWLINPLVCQKCCLVRNSSVSSFVTHSFSRSGLIQCLVRDSRGVSFVTHWSLRSWLICYLVRDSLVFSSGTHQSSHSWWTKQNERKTYESQTRTRECNEWGTHDSRTRQHMQYEWGDVWASNKFCPDYTRLLRFSLRNSRVTNEKTHEWDNACVTKERHISHEREEVCIMEDATYEPRMRAPLTIRKLLKNQILIFDF